ncbi:thioredoxin family protein [Myxococcota bacterium]|nr:thioredoxin family protein [Myxococcota bacterium]
MGFLSKLFGEKRRVMPVHVEDAASWEREVLKSPLPVIVDVWSEDCAPCRMLAPVIIDVATAYEGRVKVVEISTSAASGLLASLNVMATPTILVLKRGREIGRISGYRPKTWFDEMIAAELVEPASPTS